MKKTLAYLTEQKDSLDNIRDLSSDEYDFELQFVSEKISAVEKRIELCKQELNLLKSEENKC